MVDQVSPDQLVGAREAPQTIEGWKALADGLLTDQACVFHRNMEISSRYAWIYAARPSCFKWAGMAAFASYHVRLALAPFQLDTDRGGHADIAHTLGRRRGLLLADVDTIRETNNAIFDDIFWVHLAYASADDGIGRLRAVLDGDDGYASILAGFEAIDRGRHVLEDATATERARRKAEALIWNGNIALLEHEQRALVQPHFDRLSCAYARLLSLGSTLSFEAHGVRQELAYFSAFYLFSFGRGLPQVLQARAWPRVTRFDDRWRWIVTSIVPRFQRLEADRDGVDTRVERILDDARHYASKPCVLPLPAVA